MYCFRANPWKIFTIYYYLSLAPHLGNRQTISSTIFWTLLTGVVIRVVIRSFTQLAYATDRFAIVIGNAYWLTLIEELGSVGGDDDVPQGIQQCFRLITVSCFSTLPLAFVLDLFIDRCWRSLSVGIDMQWPCSVYELVVTDCLYSSFNW